MTVLIKDVRVLGGERDLSEYADVFINDGRIAAIGNFPKKSADLVLDGGGAYLSPGFIDVNTSSDHYLSLLEYPSQEDFLKQGITTIMGGMCGSSLAPLLYGSLESVQKWGDIQRVNVNWHTMGEFLAVLDKRPLGVNFGTLVGHSTVRRAIVGDSLRNLTKNELTILAETLRRTLNDGAFGLSTGLGYVHGRNTAYSEIKNLTKIVKDAGGVYATHLRKSGLGLTESVAETLELAIETGVKTLINHFLPLTGAEKEYEVSLGKFNDLHSETDLHFDLYPYDTSVLALYTFLPEWAQSGDRNEELKALNDEWKRKKIADGFAKLDPENFTVAQAPGNPFLVSKSLNQLVGLFNLRNWRAALVKLMADTELRGIVFFRNVNAEAAQKALFHKRSLIASNAASFDEKAGEKILKPERAMSTFTKFLEITLRENAMPLDEAIRKITRGPAQKFGLADRGIVKEGYWADLTCFSPETDGSVSVKFVLVNGCLTLEDGEFKNVPSGKVLRHRSSS